MAIDASMPVSREIGLVSAVPQTSLARRDRELQVEEGQPPMEVAEAQMEALRWRKNADLREKWKRREERRAMRKASEVESEELEEAVPELLSAESFEGGETGTLFDDRS